MIIWLHVSMSPNPLGNSVYLCRVRMSKNQFW